MDMEDSLGQTFGRERIKHQLNDLYGRRCALLRSDHISDDIITPQRNHIYEEGNKKMLGTGDSKERASLRTRKAANID